LFLFRLAKELGRTVEELINTMSTVEMRAWAEYFVFVNEQEKEAATKRGP
jgi:hypothetical protein